jgi:hypothetical protein
MKSGLFHVIVILFVFTTRLFGQTGIISDSVYVPYFENTLIKAGIPTYDSENLLEFRIWVVHSLSPYNKCLFRIYQTNDSVWNAEKYEFDLKHKKTIFHINRKSKLYTEYERVGNADSMKNTIDTLISLGIMALPDWYSIKDSCFKSGLDENGYELRGYIAITDGTSYKFEVLSKDLKRKYEYHSPESYFKHCNKLPELKSITRILQILFKEFDYNEGIC